MDIRRLPDNLKESFWDVMILYAEDDREFAQQYKSHLENISLGGSDRIKVALYDEIGVPGRLEITGLEYSFSRAQYTFMLVTENFVNGRFEEFASVSCIAESLSDRDKMWCVIPVYTDDPKFKKYKIPFSMGALTGLNHWNKDSFMYVEGIKHKIKEKIHERKAKEMQLQTEREQAWMKIQEEDEQETQRRKEEEIETSKKLEGWNMERVKQCHFNSSDRIYSEILRNFWKLGPCLETHPQPENPNPNHYWYNAVFNIPQGPLNQNPFLRPYNLNKNWAFNSINNAHLHSDLMTRKPTDLLGMNVNQEQHEQPQSVEHHHHYHYSSEPQPTEVINIIGATNVHLGDGHHFNNLDGVAEQFDMRVDSEDDSNQESNNSTSNGEESSVIDTTSSRESEGDDEITVIKSQIDLDM